ncbi:MAG: MFS transporter [Flavobacteriales bacterium]|nr:MFS transporter [Flavobacteriales bacterium]MCB9448105.1 MFS transporter [Flavobacteriales bacterium]
MPLADPKPSPPGFTRYQVFIVAILTILQFTIVLDFMVLAPLGYILLDKLHITPHEFGLVVSAYAFSAGISGFLAAGFADKFDRKRMLLFFYGGFILGTFLCGFAPTYELLMGARILTGIFGGVISSISFAIITDLFAFQQRGRVMGFVQMAFAASQILGLPVGLYLANQFDWHAPFLMIAALSIPVAIVVSFKMKPVNEHLKLKSEKNAFLHLWHTLKEWKYVQAFLTTTLLATGGFMLMPFSTAFLVNNVGLTEHDLPQLFMFTGLFSVVTGPIIGRLSDVLGKFRVFAVGSVIGGLMVYVYTNLPPSTFWLVLAINVILFIGISSRIISATALITAVPEPKDRGAFMGINSSIQQVSGGIASVIAGLIVDQKGEDQPILHFNTIGWVVVCSMAICILMMWNIDRNIISKKEPVDVPVSSPGKA